MLDTVGRIFYLLYISLYCMMSLFRSLTFFISLYPILEDAETENSTNGQEMLF